jgi:hypothetical protein
MPAKTKAVKRGGNADARTARRLADLVRKLGRSISAKNEKARPGYLHVSVQRALEHVGTARVALLEVAHAIGETS